MITKAGTVEILKIAGMNDVKTSEGFYVDEQSYVAEPSAILNADVDIRGRLVKRSGRTLYYSLPGAHSIWAGQSCMLCADSAKLYRVVNRTVTEIGNIDGPPSALSYVETGDLVYISNPYWKAIYNHATGTLSSWGIPLPPVPVVLSGTGSLPAGVYNLCMTARSGAELSGNGPIATITLYSDGGIQILNRPSGAIVWCTDCNEGTFYRIGEADYVQEIITVEPLPSLFCHPPYFMTNLCHAFGRIWGSVGNIVYYSQPFQLSWFRANMNQFVFDTEVNLIARVPTGLFVGTSEKTLFLHGTEPAKMEQTFAGAGSIKGTLAYCNNLPELGDILGTAEKGYVDVPVWRTVDGIVAGNASGKLYNLSKNKITMDSAPEGASLYRNAEGTFQFLTSSIRGISGSSVGALSPDTLKLLEDGHISRHEFTHQGQGSTASFQDTATADLNKYFGRDADDTQAWTDDATYAFIAAGNLSESGDLMDEAECTVTRGGIEI